MTDSQVKAPMYSAIQETGFASYGDAVLVCRTFRMGQNAAHVSILDLAPPTTG